MEKELEIKTGCDRGLCKNAIGRQDRQLNTYDWLADVPGNADTTDLVEVQFKHTRKGYYHNVNNLPLKKGDIVAVEANPGHDIGVVTLTGRLVHMQLKKANLKSADDIRRIYRIARQTDIDKFKESKRLEHATMIESRQIAKNLGLKMKIGDVEYQGDGQKAIFYYIADERVDFRQLIKDLAAAFHIRVEMKQIGARQEAGLIGGTGPCGRELCCATWMKNFVSVGTSSARFQDISLNPQGRHSGRAYHLLYRQEHCRQSGDDYCRTCQTDSGDEPSGRETGIAIGGRQEESPTRSYRLGDSGEYCPFRPCQEKEEKEEEKAPAAPRCPIVSIPYYI